LESKISRYLHVTWTPIGPVKEWPSVDVTVALKVKLPTFLGNISILTPLLLKLPIVPKYLEKSDKFNSTNSGTRTLIPFIGLLLRF